MVVQTSQVVTEFVRYSPQLRRNHWCNNNTERVVEVRSQRHHCRLRGAEFQFARVIGRDDTRCLDGVTRHLGATGEERAAIRSNRPLCPRFLAFSENS